MSTSDPRRRAVLVLTSVGDDESAARLARLLVEENLAACVTCSAAKSVYRWEAAGNALPREMAICEEDEVMLVVKTSRARVADVEGRLRQVHPYACPEIVVVEAAHVEARYLEWLLACVE
jgi:periplasmic divalent cation tolerance protein